MKGYKRVFRGLLRSVGSAGSAGVLRGIKGSAGVCWGLLETAAVFWGLLRSAEFCRGLQGYKWVCIVLLGSARDSS